MPESMTMTVEEGLALTTPGKLFHTGGARMRLRPASIQKAVQKQ